MPHDDYAPVVRGALKLKGSGAGPTGITKKKKKKPKGEVGVATKAGAEEGALIRAPVEEDAVVAGSSKGKGKAKDVGEDGGGGEDDGGEGVEVGKLRELDPRGEDGKTASERAYEEMRRKRVCCFYFSSISDFVTAWMDIGFE